MSAADIRKSLNILVEGTDYDSVHEAAPMGFLKTLSNKAGSYFSKGKAGELETGKEANALYKNYKTFLGKITRKPGTEEVGDMATFLTNEGIPKDVIFTAISRGFSTPRLPVQIKNEQDLQKWWKTDIKTDYKNKIGKVFLNVSAEMARQPKDDSTPEARKARAQRQALGLELARKQADHATQATNDYLNGKPKTNTNSISVDDIDAALSQLGGL